MDIKKIVKVLSVVVPVAGAGISLVSSWLDDQKLDQKIAEKVSEALEPKA